MHFVSIGRLMPLFLMAWAVYIFYPFSISEPTISADGVTYVHIAKNIVLDGSLGWQATWTSPFFSILIALLYPIFNNYVISGIIVSKIMLLMLPLSIYLLGRSVFSPRIALFAAILVTFHPHFIFISNSLEPEISYTTLLILSLWALWKGVGTPLLEDENRLELPTLSCKGFLWAGFSGILASLSYQTRSEGLLIFFFALFATGNMALLAWWKEGQKKVLITTVVLSATAIVAFLLTALPYLLFLKDTYGKVVLSPKSAYVQIWMKSRIYHDNNLGEIGNPELWGLSKNGKLMWQEPRGTGDLIHYLMSHPKKSLKVYFQNLSMEVPGRIPNNSGQWLYPQVYPLYFVLPALYWLAIAFRRKDDRKKTIYILAPFSILLILPVFTAGWWKYLLPYAPFLILLAAAGITRFSEKIGLRGLTAPIFIISVVIYSLWAIKASQTYQHGNRDIKQRVSMAEEQKKVGEWAQTRFSGTPNYMIPWSKLAYYLNGRWTAMPVANIYGTLRYAKSHNVDYLVYEAHSSAQKDQLLAYFSRVPKMQLAQIYKSQTSGYHVLFFKLVR